MMALLLPQCAPADSQHQLAFFRQRLSLHRSRTTARASTKCTASCADHFKIPSNEPCCNLVSPLVVTPSKPGRRSSRLRVRRGSREDSLTDADAAEWINRVTANNGEVEVDPVTMAEQMRYYQAESAGAHTHYHSSNSSDVYPPGRSGFPARVPLGVALAAGTAVALAIIALLIQALHKERDEANAKSSDSEGKNLTSSFKGDPVPNVSSQVSRQAKETKEVLAGSAAAAAGASTYQLNNLVGRDKTPPPPSTGSKFDKYDSVTPFFSSDKSSGSSSRTPPSSGSKWDAEKYKSVRPFFADDVVAEAIKNAEPFFPDEQGNSDNGLISNVTPFFADEQKSSNGPSLDATTPFFADEQKGSSGSGVDGKAETVKPFFPDDQVAGTPTLKKQSSWSRLTQFWDGKNNTGGRTDSLAQPAKMADLIAIVPLESPDSIDTGRHEEFASQTEGGVPELARALSADDPVFLDDLKAEEEQRYAKMRALQAAVPALAIGAGAVGALVGVDGAFEMVGVTATASFISYELLWADKRKELIDEISRITDHHQLFSFLQKRKIVKDDC